MQFNFKILILIAELSFNCVFISIQSFGQVEEEVTSCGPAIEKEIQQGGIYDIVDEPASFPGGVSALRVFLADNLVFSEGMIGDGSKRKYYVKFIVDKDGTCRNFTIIKVINECLGCDKEVLRVLQLMPKWKPGLVEGKPVSSWFRLPVTFGLQ
ncbi:MAG: hypothetical protein K0S23_2755 [Fluviicola sp.]|jgi:protein TonB|uniref:energy transducer TonB n=1 Tax=Fluviicola sp. TaxID=1917219 RepID=UPI002606CDBC|nr:energy transducer TonB [Fluviicola sp.]MDF3028448.1 hypothetical protein [Fluviicola sp.]